MAEIEPDYLQAYELCMSSNLFLIGNMMVCRKDIFDMFIAIAYENTDAVKMQIDAIPLSNPNVLDLTKILNEKFDEVRWKELKKIQISLN